MKIPTMKTPTMKTRNLVMTFLIPFLCRILCGSAAATEVLPLHIDSGDTAWMLVATALVLVMTPGLAFFYGGMVQTKNVVSTLFQSFVALGIVGVFWAVIGYSLVFSGDHHGLIGNAHWAFLRGIGTEPNADYAATIPHELTIGTILTGVFAAKAVNPAGADGWIASGNFVLMRAQLLSSLAVVAVSALGTLVLLKVVGSLTALQVTVEEERQGLDLTQHGEWIHTGSLATAITVSEPSRAVSAFPHFDFMAARSEKDESGRGDAEITGVQ